MKPFDPRLLRAASQTKYFLLAAVATSLTATAGTLIVAYALTQFVVGVFVDGLTGEDVYHWLFVGLAGALIRAGSQYLSELAGYRTSRGIKRDFRDHALKRASSSKFDAGSMSQLLGPGLDSLDAYFGKFLPQLAFTLIVTPIFILTIWVNDPISAISILLTLPLIPIFMILIGLVTKDVQDEQLNASTKLSAHFLEVIRGITTLKLFGRIDRQLEILREVSREQKVRTMKVLRLSFLSGFALELAASLSVALIAVQIGLRLVDGAMELSVGLFVLLLAPEVYLPLRNVGAQFHNSSEGVAATTKMLDLLDQGSQPKFQSIVPERGITVVTGPSGVGKSTLLRGMVGKESAWMPQGTHLFAGSIAENIAGFEEIDQKLLERSLTAVGLPCDFGSKQVAGTSGVSGGQGQRVALARALYRLWSKELKLLLLDEPTSMLDEGNQAVIASLLKNISASGVDVVIASHQSTMLALANHRQDLEVTGAGAS